jgi:hypothetical protein
MAGQTLLHSLPGGQALFEWFGHLHRFHDANLLEIALNSKGASTLRVHTWRMTDKVDALGYFETRQARRRDHHFGRGHLGNTHRLQPTGNHIQS